MSEIFSYRKTVDEKERLGIKMINRLQSGESISSCTHVITDENGADVTSTLMVASSDEITDADGDGKTDRVSIRVQAGTDGQDYLWRALATTSAGDKIEGELRIEVRD